MVTLRPYQQDLADAVRNAYRAGYQCPLLVASTGLGKTVIFSYVTHGAAQRGNPVLLVAHRREIIRQISLSLAKFGVEHQVISSADAVRAIKVAHFRAFGRSFVSPFATTMVGSVQTIVGRLATIDATMDRVRQDTGRPAKLLVVQDEAHHCVEETQWGRVMEHCAKYNALGLLVTASPERLDGTGLGKGHGGFADTMIEAPPMAWAIDNGYLSPYRVFTTAKPIDMTGAKHRRGDYAKEELEARADRPSITGDAIQHWRQHANGMRTVVFCVSVKHSQHVAAEFAAAGIPSAHIDGGIDDAERDKAITDFAAGRVLVLCNCSLVAEGFDLASIAQSDATIDCLVDLAPTESLVNAMQRWGRVLRPGPGKVAVILDHAGNVLRHGLPDDERDWSLEGRKKRKRGEADNTPDVHVMTCEMCFSVHRPAPSCPVCGYQYPIQDRKIEQIEGELVELTDEDRAAMIRQQRQAQGKAQTVDDLMAQMGYSRGRAEKIIEAREEKAALQEKARGILVDWHAKHKIPIKTAFGVYTADIKTMKPKELRGLIERVKNFVV